MIEPAYLTDPAEIYRRSFATIRAEADLARFSGAMEAVAIRMIHACGMVDLAPAIAFSPDAAEVGIAALRAGAPVICDAEMVRHGIIRRLLPAANATLCRIGDPRVDTVAQARGTTRSAAQVDLWREDLAGSLVVVGNAPTALFRLLEILEDGAPPPALVVGVPVGFVGAVEAKQALFARAGDVPFITVHDRRGGSAIAAAALNALAGECR
ncbi:precorrin-8X methylmutase [Pararhizobium mangrovi]|uniref:Precorrin-8X methylmutase n=1 Tax=Pararhizobium mangrovi TaxID=2590452 RepID=A0A506UBH0_9HYPH|nr:precorrin-8X methylmutase [Pararhizobium mangrovi]TPW31290.1 precorrin-8X methylmutase [Pararhizobium mangrovi]